MTHRKHETPKHTGGYRRVDGHRTQDVWIKRGHRGEAGYHTDMSTGTTWGGQILEASGEVGHQEHMG